MIIIQDTWNSEDDKDLLKYIDDNKIEHLILNKDEINEIVDINKYSVIFADTSIIQNILKKQGIHNDYNSYDKLFEKFYKRKISIGTYDDLKMIEKPYFVKPYYNDKSFEAVIVENDTDLKLIPKTGKIYVCEYVQFVNEFRLFISDYNKYNIVESSSFIISPNKIKKIKEIEEIEEQHNFINDILKINSSLEHSGQSPTYKDIIIDIGVILRNGIYEWVIVEINPPYALTSYDLPIRVYYDYCNNAWKNINISDVRKPLVYTL